MSSISRVLMGCLALLASIALASPALAQRQLGAIQGTITDQTGGVLPGVTVSATNKETGEVRTAVTNESGIYRIQSLDPGRYDVAAELSSFSKAGRNDVIVSVGATFGLNLSMATGTLTEVVQVAGVSPDIQTEKAEVSSIVERQRIVDLPIAGRNRDSRHVQPGSSACRAGPTSWPRNRDGLQRQRPAEWCNNAMVIGLSINGGPWSGTCCWCRTPSRFRSSRSSPTTRPLSMAGTPAPPQPRHPRWHERLPWKRHLFHRSNDLSAKHTSRPGREDSKETISEAARRPNPPHSAFFFVSYEGVRETSRDLVSSYTVETEQFVTSEVHSTESNAAVPPQHV